MADHLDSVSMLAPSRRAATGAIPLSQDTIACRADVELRLIDGFDLRHRGTPAAVPGGGRRVIAFLALHNRPVRRGYVACSLWPDVFETHASSLLRSALSRLRRSGLDVVAVVGDCLYLAPAVAVDLHDIEAAADRLSRGEEVAPENCASLLEALEGDLLPEWDEDWLLVVRQRHQELRMHALEALCVAFTASKQFSLAVRAGLSAVAADPLRESAQRALIEAYLGEGNPSQAVRQYDRYRTIVADELGLVPTEHLEAIIKAARDRSWRARSPTT